MIWNSKPHFLGEQVGFFNEKEETMTKGGTVFPILRPLPRVLAEVRRWNIYEPWEIPES
jgi:hypothetical protein